MDRRGQLSIRETQKASNYAGFLCAERKLGGGGRNRTGVRKPSALGSTCLSRRNAVKTTGLADRLPCPSGNDRRD